MHNASMLYVRARLAETGGPAYLGIVKALAQGIDSGDLRPGLPLPSQRVLARELGLHFTTVTRAYGEAKRRGPSTCRASGLRPCAFRWTCRPH